jgi:hypothetical protein
MHPNRSLLLAGTAALFLAACSSDTLSPTGPAAIATARRSLGDAAAAGPGPFVSGLAPNLCADVWTESRTPGAEVKSYGCHGGANQQFALEASGAITAYGGALCLDVWGAQANDGDAVVVWACHGGANQRWTRTPAGELRTAVNGKCLDLWGAQAVTGARLSVHSCHGGANQKWTINDASATPPDAGPGDTTYGTAQLPQATVDVRPAAVTGRSIPVPVGGDLQGALNAAAPGDEIVLAPGATYVGNFVLPAKANAAGQWITVRTGGNVPAVGTRVSPADAGQMPKILTPSVAPAIATAPAAQGWRIIGVEVGLVPGLPWAYSIVNFGDGGSGQSSSSQVPTRLVLERSYVHASPTTDVRRCVTLNSGATALVDSYLGDCHSRMGDSQAIYGWNGPGPFRIENNYLEGGHEVVAFGGSTPAIAGLIPSDVEIRRNHITRPLSWRGVWQEKNLFELKSGQRFLLEGNVLENNWVDAQSGFAVVLQGLSDENDALQNRVWDITMRNNIIRNTAAGVNLLSRVAYNGGALPTEPMRRITLANNFISLNGALGGVSRAIQIMEDVRNVTVAKNTIVGDLSMGLMLDGLPTSAFKVLDNVFGPAAAPVMGNGAPTAVQTFAKFAPDGQLSNNVFVAAASSGFPSANYTPPSFDQAGIQNAGSGDYRVTTRPSFLPAGATLPGVNFATLGAATAGVVR